MQYYLMKKYVTYVDYCAIINEKLCDMTALGRQSVCEKEISEDKSWWIF